MLEWLTDQFGSGGWVEPCEREHEQDLLHSKQRAGQVS
jgi:hypothetical protein